MVVNPSQSATPIVSTLGGQLFILNMTNNSYRSVVLNSDIHPIDQLIPLNGSHALTVYRDQSIIELISLENAAAQTLLCKNDDCCSGNIHCLSLSNIQLGQVAVRNQDPYQLIFENGSSVTELNLNHHEPNPQLLFSLADEPTKSILSWDDKSATITSIAPHSDTAWKYSRYNFESLETISRPVYFRTPEPPSVILQLSEKYLLLLSNDKRLTRVNMRNNDTAQGCTDQLSTRITFTTANEDNCKNPSRFHAIAIEGEYVYALDAAAAPNSTLLIFKYFCKYIIRRMPSVKHH